MQGVKHFQTGDASTHVPESAIAEPAVSNRSFSTRLCLGGPPPAIHYGLQPGYQCFSRLCLLVIVKHIVLSPFFNSRQGLSWSEVRSCLTRATAYVVLLSTRNCGFWIEFQRSQRCFPSMRSPADIGASLQKCGAAVVWSGTVHVVINGVTVHSCSG